MSETSVSVPTSPWRATSSVEGDSSATSAAAPAALVRYVKATRAPAAARAPTMTRPSPDEPPVTSAILEFSVTYGGRLPAATRGAQTPGEVPRRSGERRPSTPPFRHPTEHPAV